MSASMPEPSCEVHQGGSTTADDLNLKERLPLRQLETTLHRTEAADAGVDWGRCWRPSGRIGSETGPGRDPGSGTRGSVPQPVRPDRPDPTPSPARAGSETGPS